MYPLLLTYLSACLLGSCTLADWQAKTPVPVTSQAPTPTPQSQVASTTTQEVLTAAYQEELLAHDIYTKMVEKYPTLSEVNNIIASEAEHQNSVGQLLDARGITRPTNYGIYQSTYDTLLSMINTSLTGAIEVGIMVETGDIDHLVEEYKKVSDTDIRRVFENIGGASFNHLRAFMRLAQTYHYTPQTPTAKYLSDTETQSGGPLKYKMTELLQANGLPTYGATGGGMHHSGRGNGGGNGSGMGMGRMNR